VTEITAPNKTIVNNTANTTLAGHFLKSKFIIALPPFVTANSTPNN
jgi:hypothetical protein